MSLLHPLTAWSLHFPRGGSFSYDASDRIIQITDPLLSPDTRTVGFAYDPATGDLNDVTDVKGGTTTYTYSSRRLETLTDSNGNIAMQNCYNDANRVYKQFNAPPTLQDCANPDPGVAITLASYDSPGDGQTTVTDPKGAATIYTFDTSFRTTEIKDDLGSTVGYEYDTENNVTCVTDQRGNKTAYSYDSLGNVTQIIDALNTDTNCGLAPGGDTWTFTYTSLNDIESGTDPLSRVTNYIYDGAGNLTRVVRKDTVGAIVSLACLEPNTEGLTEAIVESTDLVLPSGPTDPCTGNRTQFGYDNSGNQTCVVSPLFPSEICDGVGDETVLNYDTGGRLTDITNELGHTTTYTYDAQNNVLTVADNLANTISNTYDAKGKYKTVTDANRQPVGPAETGNQCGTIGGSQRLPLDEVVSSSNLTGATVTNLDDDPDSPDGDWATATSVADTSLRAGFPTPPGDPALGADLQEFRVLLRKDATGGNDPTYDIELWETGGGAPLATLASGATLSSDMGVVVSVTWDAGLLGTPDGSAVELAIVGHQSGGSPSSRRTVEVGAVEWNVDYELSSTGNDLDDDGDTVTDDGCPSTIYSYDSADRLVEVVDALGQSTTYGYDASGNRTSVTNAKRQPVDVAETGAQCGAAGTGDGIDDDGDTIKDDGCPSVISAFDALDRLQSTTDSLGRVSSYEYDPAGNLDKLTDARREAVGPAETGADCGSTGAGNGVDEDADTVPDDGCPTTVYTYDSLNRLDRQEHSDAFVDYTYDAVSNRLTMVDSTGQTDYAYDTLNRPTSVTNPARLAVDAPEAGAQCGSAGTGDGVDDDADTVPDDGCPSFIYGYDEVGNRTTIAYPEATTVTYTFYEDGSMETVSDPARPVVGAPETGSQCGASKTGDGVDDDGCPSTAYTYDNAGGLTKTQYPPDLTSISYTYDNADRLTKVTHNQILPDEFEYILDAVGNRTELKRNSTLAETYQYDDLYRLTGVDYLDDGSFADYIYDPVDNRTMLTTPAGSTQYDYDDADQLTQVGLTPYTYDANGNLAGRGNEGYVWDHENRLGRIRFGGFDPNDQLGKECSDLTGNGEVNVGDVIFGFLGKIFNPPNYDPFPDADGDGDLDVGDVIGLFLGQILETCPRYYEYNGDGLRTGHTLGKFVTSYNWDIAAALPVLLQETTWELHCVQPGGVPPCENVPADLVAETTYVYGLDLISATDETGAQRYYFPDGLGSTVLTIQGDQASTYEYDVFGELRSGGPTSETMLFTGEQFDAKARHNAGGLYYLRARYYDPEIGRFLSQDQLPAGNLYAYVGNNPVNYVDPSGFSAQEGGNFGQYIAFAGTACAIPAVADGPFPFGEISCLVSVPVILSVGACIIFCGDGISEIGELLGILNSDGGGGRYGGDPRTAGEIISQEKRGSINQVWPGEWRDKTYDEIKKAADAGIASAKKAKKLLDKHEYDK